MALSHLQLNPQFVQAVRDAVDVVDVASGYTKLVRAGRKWKGLCPLHKEKTPSFNVDADLGFFKCFGCGAGGDGIKLHMLLTGDDFAAAMESLAQRYGVPLPARAASHRGYRDSAEAERDPERALEAAAAWFREQLARSAEARGYLERRQLPRELVDRFGLGYAPEGWRNLLQALGAKHPVGDLLAAGLVVRPDGGGEPYDRFRHRLVFPIRTASGRLVGFGGRALGDDPAKYLNTAETERFRKGTLLYGLDQAKRAIRDGRRALLVEGYLDVLGAVASGIETAVATMGTALTPEQARLLARFGDEVVLGYDGDEAGQTAARRALPILLGQGLAVRLAKLPEGEDPDSLRRSAGEAAVRAAYDQAQDLVLVEIARLVPGDLHRQPHARPRAAKAATELLAAIPDPLTRFGYARAAADRLGVPLDLLLRKLGGGRAELERTLAPPASVESGGRGRERQALRILLQRVAGGLPIDLGASPPPAEAFSVPEYQEFFAAFLRLYGEAGESPSLAAFRDAVQGRVDSSAILADILIESIDSPTGEDLGEALRDLRRSWVKSRRLELVRRIREAEERDDRALVDELYREKRRLESELYPTAPIARHEPA
jgi:DNA primase